MKQCAKYSFNPFYIDRNKKIFFISMAVSSFVYLFVYLDLPCPLECEQIQSVIETKYFF